LLRIAELRQGQKPVKVFSAFATSYSRPGINVEAMRGPASSHIKNGWKFIMEALSALIGLPNEVSGDKYEERNAEVRSLQIWNCPH
jgi:hypothetical protein